jgi:hypothetical protein
MVPAEAIDPIISELLPLLAAGDTLVDGGNSNYKDTVGRAQRLAEKLHVLQALGYLASATALGMVLALAPRSTDTLRLAKVYGVCGLLGFFGTMILGVGGRHLPVLAWTRAMLTQGPPARSPYRLRSSARAAAEFASWSLGVPLLALASWREAAAGLSLAAWLLLAEVVASAANQIRAIRLTACDDRQWRPQLG